MIINKITYGFVVQTFDSQTGKCLEQEFIAGDQVDFEDRNGQQVDDDEITDGLHCPFEMKKPERMAEDNHETY